MGGKGGGREGGRMSVCIVFILPYLLFFYSSDAGKKSGNIMPDAKQYTLCLFLKVCTMFKSVLSL